MISENQHLINNINLFIDGSTKNKISFSNAVVFKDDKNNGYYRCIINNHEYRIIFRGYHSSTSSFIQLYDSMKENPSIIQYTIDKSNFKINGDKFNLIQNRGLTIGRKIPGVDKQFKELMYARGFSNENIIATGDLMKIDYHDFIDQLFKWIAIRANVKFQLEERYRDVENSPTEEELNTDDLLDIESRTEGGTQVIISVKAERNYALREAATKIHGLICQACGFNFEEMYGHWGDGYIEVHHLIPLSEAKKRETNPRFDLSVVCSNCHRMIHRKKGITLTINELKRKLNT